MYHLDKTQPFTGTAISKSKNGSIYEIHNYKDGLHHGETIIYGSNSKIRCLENFKHGVSHGQFYTLRSSGEYVEAIVKDGITVKSTEYYPSGALKSEIPCISGSDKITGKWVQYYENGSIMSEMFYENSRKNGEETLYFDNGQMKSRGHYTRNKKTGLFQTWDRLGNITSEIMYNNGMAVDTMSIENIEVGTPVT